MSERLPAHLVLYDGECGLCQRSVRMLLHLDRRAKYRFAPLQGQTGGQIRQNHPELAGLGSIVLVETAADGTQQIFRRSTAVLRIVSGCGGLFHLARACLIVPRPWRDAAYDFIARHRYRWFGRNASCPLPAPEMRERFLP
jgi:predicted DCC family thiol-disulfide oxidoreductase YuxK